MILSRNYMWCEKMETNVAKDIENGLTYCHGFFIFKTNFVCRNIVPTKTQTAITIHMWLFPPRCSTKLCDNDINIHIKEYSNV